MISCHKHSTGLFVSDVDGTLLRSDHVLPEAVADASRTLSASGVTLVLASARSPRGVSIIMKGMTTSPLAVCYNGAWVGNPLTGEALHSNPLSLPAALTACDIIRQLGGTAMWCASDAVYALSSHARVAKPVADVATDRLMLVENLDTMTATPLKILGIFDRDADRHVASIRSALSDMARVQTSGVRFVEVTHSSVAKSTGAEEVRRHLGIERTSTFAAGDAGNDLDLLAWASRPLTVANAVPEALALAERVFPSCDEAGMAEAFRWASDYAP